MKKIKPMNELQKELFNALSHGTEEEQQKAFAEFINGIQNIIIDEAQSTIQMQSNAINDESILVGRGIKKALTTNEKQYFNAVIDKRGFANVELAFPTTIIQDIFTNLKNEHPILSRVDIKNTEALSKFIISDTTTKTAFWGDITADIKQIIINGFKVLDIQSSKLAGFIPTPKAVFDLGANWLAEYVITVLTEIISTSIELAIVNGTGKKQPVGMMRKLTGVLDSEYQEKQKITLNDLSAKSLAGIRGAMAKAKTDTTGVSILVNPETYWAKVFPNLAFRDQAGNWITDKLPTGEEIINSYAVPKDTLIFGDLKQYFLGVSGAMRIDKYTETLAIEDMDLHIAKFIGYGIPKNENSFFVADVTNIDGATIAPLDETLGV